MEWKVIGVDPAPSKPTTVWTLNGPRTIAAGKLRETLEDEANGDAVLVAWDAPLSFDSRCGFADRPIDRAVRRFVRRHEKVEPKAVAALPFSGCSHWAITCGVLGFPYGTGNESQWSLAEQGPSNDPGHFLLEVNPSVALAIWWMEHGADVPMPLYKGSRSQSGRDVILSYLRPRLNIPAETSRSDDLLDAWVAFKLGSDFLRGEAKIVGNPREGAYLLPKSAASHRDLLAFLELARNELLQGASKSGVAWGV